MKELFNVSTNHECRLWLYGNVEQILSVSVLLSDLETMSDEDSSIRDDDTVRIRYIYTSLYLLFVLGIPYLHVRSKKS